ncbi:UDP-2,3-diacylglucosamine diphosphatase [Halosquirtibacter laminarini]|uniref:UDP-2,3-diacylglucosamine diphosphatase n=1 Tax=Halosquirtibacter laminarini TaxID=3374600 RepID=A0AC61NQW5_9BACT|nr:UDP-2,3-diacylglucosamine diphosphatase [Prolixibacteraceae bacterium]
MVVRDKIYFISDLHLGASALDNNRERELHLVKWLKEIEPSAKELFLVGDIFDFWYEYKYVVPKGFVRFFGQLCHMIDQGVEIHFFTGNHDVWAFDYLQKEIGLKVYYKPKMFVRNGKKIFVGHGDGLNPDDTGYLLLNKVFKSKVAQRLFSWIHPDIAFSIANRWSKHSRLSHPDESEYFEANMNKEEQLRFAISFESVEKVDYLIFGHRHVFIDHQLPKGARLIILGEWIQTFSYAVFDGENISLRKYPMEDTTTNHTLSLP